MSKNSPGEVREPQNNPHLQEPKLFTWEEICGPGSIPGMNKPEAHEQDYLEVMAKAIWGVGWQEECRLLSLQKKQVMQGPFRSIITAIHNTDIMGDCYHLMRGVMIWNTAFLAVGVQHRNRGSFLGGSQWLKDYLLAAPVEKLLHPASDNLIINPQVLPGAGKSIKHGLPARVMVGTGKRNNEKAQGLFLESIHTGGRLGQIQSIWHKGRLDRYEASVHKEACIRAWEAKARAQEQHRLQQKLQLHSPMTAAAKLKKL